MPLNRPQFDIYNNVSIPGGIAAPNIINNVASSSAPIDFSNASSVAGMGLDLVPITSVSYSSGTAWVSGGQVQFIGCQSIYINNCFSSKYTNYRLMINLTGTVNTANVWLRLRSNGFDTASAYRYVMLSYSVVNGTGTPFPAVSASATRVELFTYWGAGSVYSVDILQPFVAAPTQFTFLGWGSDSPGTNPAFNIGGAQQDTSNSYDGISIVIPLAGPITGSARLYGYRG